MPSKKLSNGHRIRRRTKKNLPHLNPGSSWVWWDSSSSSFSSGSSSPSTTVTVAKIRKSSIESGKKRTWSKLAGQIRRVRELELLVLALVLRAIVGAMEVVQATAVAATVELTEEEPPQGKEALQEPPQDQIKGRSDGLTESEIRRLKKEEFKKEAKESEDLELLYEKYIQCQSRADSYWR